MKSIIKKIALSLFAICSALYVSGQATQTTVTFKIGDVPPPLKVAKWVKGVPVNHFDKDSVYVIEFWATWCGPCRAAMPHLSELAKRYAGKVTFIGVDIWEDNENPQKKSYEQLMQSAEQLVTDMGDKMAYNVALDTRDNFIGNNWMHAAGLSAIPSSFLIKSGKLVWVGEPWDLDETLTAIFAGKYDMNAFAAKYVKENEAQDALMASVEVAMKPLTDALQAKDTVKAINEISAISIALPQYNFLLKNLKLTLLLDKNDIPDALTCARAWQKEAGPVTGRTITPMIAQRNNLPKNAYQLAVELGNACLTAFPGGPDSSDAAQLYNDLAACYLKMGDQPNAISTEKKSVELAKQALKEGKNGYYTPTVVRQFETNLAAYEAGKAL